MGCGAIKFFSSNKTCKNKRPYWLIKELIYIRVNNPTFNRNIGKFQLNHKWDRVLFSTTNLKVAIPTGNVQHSP